MISPVSRLVRGRTAATGAAGEDDSRSAEEREGSELLVHGVFLRVSLGVLAYFRGPGDPSGGMGCATLRCYDTPSCPDRTMTAAPRRTMSWPCSVIRTRTPSWNFGERPCAEGLDGRLREGSVEKFRGAGEHDLRHVEHADDRARARCRGAPRRRGGCPRGVRRRLPRPGAPTGREPRARPRGIRPCRRRTSGPPSVPTVTWPISPAAKWLPRIGCPHASRPEPTPRPTLTSRTSSPAPPKVYSASTAAFASLATSTGRPSASCSAPSRSKPAQRRFGRGAG